MTIKEALVTISPEDDSLWTEDGLPTVEAVQILLGDETITREQITSADPEFSRIRATVKATDKGPESKKALDLPEELAVLDSRIQDLMVEHNRILGEITRLSRQRSTIQAKIFGVSTTEDDVQGRIDYIKKQNEIRAARVQKRNRILDGVDPQTLSGQAPLDAAMARKNKRGTERPVARPAPKQE